MERHDRDDGMRRERSPDPADVTADEPQAPLDGPPLDADVRWKAPTWRRLLTFTAVGAASGFAFVLFCYVGRHAPVWASGGDFPDLSKILSQCRLALAPIVGGLTGAALAVFWRARPPKPPWMKEPASTH